MYLHRDPTWKPIVDGQFEGIARMEYAPREGVSRYADPCDNSCPKCGTKETLPYRTELAVSVNVAATSYFEREKEAVERRRLRSNVVALRSDRKYPRIVVA
jgi:hypothetical protein